MSLSGRYVVFVDESGDHSLESVSTDYPIFVLAFCIVPMDDYIEHIVPRIKRLKFELFGHDQVIFHEHDIRRKKGAFSAMPELARAKLMDDLTAIIVQSCMQIVAVVIDKVRHKGKYKSPEHPYHLAMQYGLERVHNCLRSVGANVDDPLVTHRTRIVFERRGAQEDAALELAFRRVCDGSNWGSRRYPFEVVMMPKQSNAEGLQLADLVARPIGLHVLKPNQPNRAWDALEGKLFRAKNGVLHGHGLKVFP